MKEEIVHLTEDVSDSPLYSEDLAPVPADKRTWKVWNLAAIWVGMAVCIPTYILASYMIKSGLSWYAALIIIGLANIIITIPMVLNGHAGVKYGIPFPVIGRASFGHYGIHIASILRAIVACGWFGVQTWIGGLAFYAIFNALTGNTPDPGLSLGKFIGFGVFWLINIYFIVKGTESIRWLEDFAAPILVLIGIFLIVWGTSAAGGFGNVLAFNKQMQNSTAELLDGDSGLYLSLDPVKNEDGQRKATHIRVGHTNDVSESKWIILPSNKTISLSDVGFSATEAPESVYCQFMSDRGDETFESSVINVKQRQFETISFGNTLWGYIIWLTAMVGFWATMSLSIADITRYASSQADQVKGQFLGLPGAMILYSFVGIFVTFAAVINFNDIIISEDAPWDPVSLLAKFQNPAVVVIAQIFMIIATLSTNIAANVIAPANAFSNLLPRKINFAKGGVITGIIGILICPWWLLNEISQFLIIISGLLGPVLGVLLADYYWLRRTKLDLNELYKIDGIYSYGGSGFNVSALIALAIGVILALIGLWVPELAFLYKLSWFTGFIVSFFLYYILMKKSEPPVADNA